jgi:hypothetical protein
VPIQITKRMIPIEHNYVVTLMSPSEPTAISPAMPPNVRNFSKKQMRQNLHNRSLIDWIRGVPYQAKKTMIPGEQHFVAIMKLPDMQHQALTPQLPGEQIPLKTMMSRDVHSL